MENLIQIINKAIQQSIKKLEKEKKIFCKNFKNEILKTVYLKDRIETWIKEAKEEFPENYLKDKNREIIDTVFFETQILVVDHVNDYCRANDIYTHFDDQFDDRLEWTFIKYSKSFFTYKDHIAKLIKEIVKYDKNNNITTKSLETLSYKILNIAIENMFYLIYDQEHFVHYFLVDELMSKNWYNKKLIEVYK